MQLCSKRYQQTRRGSSIKRLRVCFLLPLIALSLAFSSSVHAGNQKEEAIADSVRLALAKVIADPRPPKPSFDKIEDRIKYLHWLGEMSDRLKRRIPDRQTRLELLETIWYESKRAGLEPAMVMGLMQVESGFKKYATSIVGARGYMQVMPFWIKVVGRSDDNLFHLRTNLRYGCTILKHYLDIEKGDLFRALGRYNGSLGRPEYPDAVRAAWERQWHYTPKAASRP